MGVDRLDRQEFIERIGFDRRDRVDRRVVDEKVKAARSGDKGFALAFERWQVA